MASIKLIVITLLFTLCYNKPSFSNIQNNNSETKIRSKIIHVKRKGNTVDFIKDAVIENGDTSILSDKITLIYNNEESLESNSIKEIKAKGSVTIFNQEFVATGENGIYNPNDETFTINDNVVFNNGSSIAKGEKFVYSLKKKKGFLVGNKKYGKTLKDNRVIVIINEDDE